MKKLWIALYISLSVFSGLENAGEEHKEGKNAQHNSENTEGRVNEFYESEVGKDEHSHDMKVTADLDDFPNLHPLIVHFPIVLLIIGAFLAIVNAFFLKKDIDWVITGLVLVGTLGAYLAGRTFHPHTHDLTEHAKLVLAQHDKWANWTIYLSITGLAAQVISQFVLKQRRWAVVVTALILIGSAYAVSRTGHYGAQLVHIEAVGPQGNFLETEEIHSH